MDSLLNMDSLVRILGITGSPLGSWFLVWLYRLFVILISGEPGGRGGGGEPMME